MEPIFKINMEIDGSSLPPQNAGDIDQNLLLQFSCMNTNDREELISQMQRFLGSSINYSTASFFLDMSNWNLQAAICSYLDYSLPQNPPKMKVLKSNNNVITTTTAGSSFEHSWIIVNTGIDKWPEGCVVAQSGGVNLSAAPVCVPPLSPGQSIAVHVNLVAPQNCGVSKVFFNLYTDKGDIIGDVMWAEVNVESEVTMALTEQLAAMPVPSSRSDDNTTTKGTNTSPDDQMC